MAHPNHTETQMRIRRPVGIVFNAFVDPSEAVNFWFTKSSGLLEEGKQVVWEWEMYGGASNVLTKELIPNEKITIEWGPDQNTVVFSFRDLGDNTTYVVITEAGYKETGDALLSKIRDSTGGFTTVLDGCKAWLEHGINLGLIGDKFLVK